MVFEVESCNYAADVGSLTM